MCVTLAVDRLASWLTHVSAEEGSIEQGARVTTELDRHSVYCLHRCKVIDRLISVSAEEGSIVRGARVMGELDRHSACSLHGCKAIDRLDFWLSHVSAEDGVMGEVHVSQGKLTDTVYAVDMAVRPYSGSFPGCRTCQPRKVYERGARVTKELDRHSVYSRHGCKAIQRLASRLSRKSAEERSI